MASGRASRLLGSALLTLFLLTFASGTAVEEPTLLEQPSAAKRWCHNFEEFTRYRLRKAIFDANNARRDLLRFVQMEDTPSSDPWDSAASANRTEVQDEFVLTISDEEAEEFHSRPARPIPCIAIALAIGVLGAGVAVGTGTYAIVLGHKMKTLELTQRQQQLSLDTLHEETAWYLARMDISAAEIAENFNKTSLNVEMLMNRTEELAATYRIRADVGNAITTLENLGTIAGDLPHLVHSINMLGIVHPAYVPQAVWQEARSLLRHDEHARKLWLPESRGTNATWFHRNQTLRVEVPASCRADPAVNYIKKELTHLNTSLVLRFSSWTDAQILQTEQLQKLREHARAAAARIEAE
jgi:hypothetical protein